MPAKSFLAASVFKLAASWARSKITRKLWGLRQAKYRTSQRDYFAFESKRLHVSYPGGTISTEYSAYAGDDGMGAFVESQYSKGLPCAGMLGYVMDGNVEKAWTGVAARIHARRDELCLQPKSEFIESGLKHHVACGAHGTRLGETQHDLTSHILRMLHILLPVAQRKFA